MVNIPKTGDIIYTDFEFPSRIKNSKGNLAVVVSNNQLMTTSPYVWIVPISCDQFDGDEYPLHVRLDERTKADGSICVERLKTFDYKRRKWRFLELLPLDLVEEVQKKIQLVVRKSEF